MTLVSDIYQCLPPFRQCNTRSSKFKITLLPCQREIQAVHSWGVRERCSCRGVLATILWLVVNVLLHRSLMIVFTLCSWWGPWKHSWNIRELKTCDAKIPQREWVKEELRAFSFENISEKSWKIIHTICVFLSKEEDFNPHKLKHKLDK